jgi:hypothetical protein
MTCVWDSLIAGLRRLGQLHEVQPAGFVRYLQDRNRKLSASEVTVNGASLKPSELSECFEWIRNMVFSYDGYYCSPHDPLLIWVACLFKVAIEHTFLSHTHRITPRVATAGTLFLNSTRGHMSLVRANSSSESVQRSGPKPDKTKSKSESDPASGVEVGPRSASALALAVGPTSRICVRPATSMLASGRSEPTNRSVRVGSRVGGSGSEQLGLTSIVVTPTTRVGLHVRTRSAGPHSELKCTEVRSLDQLRAATGRQPGGNYTQMSFSDRIGLR